MYAFAPSVHRYVDPLGLCEKNNTSGSAKIYHYPADEGNPYGHYSIKTIYNDEVIHTNQLITKPDFSETEIATLSEKEVKFLEPDLIVKINLPDAKSAQIYQRSKIAKQLGPYDQKTNSCIDHIAEVLRHGGIDIPRSALKQYKFLKGLGF